MARIPARSEFSGLRIRRLQGSGFSLLELLFVIALGLGLGVLAIGGFASMTQAAALSTAADRLADALNGARQDAVTHNVTVEVRIYASSGPAPLYQSLQPRELNADGTTTPVTPPVFLPTGVVIDDTAIHSPLLASNPEIAAADPGDPLLNAATRVFHFTPDGSTDLDGTKAWFATLRAAVASDPARFPSNWACLTLDATTGRVQIYRP